MYLFLNCHNYGCVIASLAGERKLGSGHDWAGFVDGSSIYFLKIVSLLDDLN